MAQTINHDAIEHGRQAKALVEDPAFLRAVDACKKAYFDEMCATKPEDTAKREQIYIAMTVVDTVVSHLTRAKDAGVLEADKLGRLSRNSK